MIGGAFLGWAAEMVRRCVRRRAGRPTGPARIRLTCRHATGRPARPSRALVAIGSSSYFAARVRHQALDLKVMTQALVPVGAIAGPGTAPDRRLTRRYAQLT